MDYSKYKGHTKGDWLITPDSPADIVCGTVKNGETVATMWSDCNDEEYKANTHLITDAPKLLARCKELEEFKKKEISAHLKDCKEYSDIVEEFKTKIAKLLELATKMKSNGEAGGLQTQVMWANAFLNILQSDDITSLVQTLMAEREEMDVWTFVELNAWGKWSAYKRVKGTWHCYNCDTEDIDGPRSDPYSSIHCNHCNAVLTRHIREGGPANPFGWIPKSTIKDS